MVMTSGELFAEIGAAIKKASPFTVTMFCGYGNNFVEGGGSYFAIASEYALGGYETDKTRYGKGGAEKFIAEAVALLKSVR